MKKILYISLLASMLFAYEDSDFDGVEDKFDRCPNTPITELVDINGCTTRSLVSLHHYDIILGASYSGSDYQTLNKTDTFSSTFQVDYYYKDFSISASTSYYSTKGDGYSADGLNDSYINASYQFKLLESLTLRVGAGVILPTYETDLNNNNLDYLTSFNLSYIHDNMTLFAAYSYTIINDDDVITTDTNGSTATITYQNSAALSMGAGYYMSDSLYLSGAYNISDSIYTSIEDIKTASVYGYYGFDAHWFSTFSYAYGISDSASKNYIAIRIGYFF
jgi:hypothetical protein